jgi:diguanylate cyclase (GGDEF)-like protein
MRWTIERLSELKAKTIVPSDRDKLDAVSGLGNRAVFIEALETACHSSHGTLLLLDIDNFRDLNYQFGHASADSMLREIAHRLQLCLKQSDFASRIAADEFAVLLDAEQGRETAYDIAERLARRLVEPMMIVGQKISLKASIGFVDLKQPGLSPDEALKQADIALKRAKISCNGKTVAFESRFNDEAHDARQLEAQLKSALRDRQIIPVFQPKLCLLSGELRGFEALARWQLPSGEMISPGYFIPVAEKTGLIDQLGNAILLRVLELMQEWQQQGLVVGQVAFNAAASHLRDENFASWVLAELERFDIPANQLILELTENILLDADMPSISATLAILRQAGVEIALDDFGTGWASLAHLRRMPIDYLKIDRSFVMTMAHNLDDAVICRAIIGLAHNLNMRVTAEGIENTTELGMLSSFGCDDGQGYLLARPMPAADVPHWIQNVLPGLQQKIAPLLGTCDVSGSHQRRTA